MHAIALVYSVLHIVIYRTLECVLIVVDCLGLYFFSEEEQSRGFNSGTVKH